jgi:phosphoribosylformylglycinamidine cyclo-ligase
MKKQKLDYAAAGVDIAAADKSLEKIKSLAKSTFNNQVLSEIGSFGGLFKPDFSEFQDPVLISSVDGVGTKLKLAFISGRHNTVGEDLVNHCVNDILVHGAKPLFFLDYIAMGKLKPETVAEIVEGLSAGCRNAGMALIGGETAELPDFYHAGEYDLAGCIVGIVDKNRIINGNSIQEGDIVIGLGSNGLHTNGYSLARKIVFEVAGLKLSDYIESLKMKIGDALMLTHRSYYPSVFPLLNEFEIKGMAHVTGGGIAGNLIRILPENTQAIVRKESWEILPIFEFLQETGSISNDDMFEAFNMGVGYILVVESGSSDSVISRLKDAGERPYIIGEIKQGKRGVLIKD